MPSGENNRKSSNPITNETKLERKQGRLQQALSKRLTYYAALIGA